MLPYLFFGQNLNFTLSLFFSLVTFATFWLYFDAWTNSKKLKDSPKWLGFLLISISFLLQAVVIDKNILGGSVLGSSPESLAVLLRLLGYTLVIVAVVREPLQAVPKNEGLKLQTEQSKAVIPAITALAIGKLLLPLGAWVIAFLYFRRAATGLERHLRSVSLAFLALGISEAFAALSVVRESSNVYVADLVAPLGVVWWLQQIFLLAATMILGRWVWSYLIKRLQSQLFMIFTSFVVLIFLIVSVSFTFLLVRNIQEESLSNLETATKVLNYSLGSKQAEIGSIGEVFAQNPEVKNAITKKDHNQLVTLLVNVLEDKKATSILITSDSGMVLARAEDPDSWGDSVSTDLLVKKALSGSQQSSIVSKEGILAPTLSLQSAQPVLQDGKAIGAVVVSLEVSNNFLDGIKESTGLDAAVYASNVRSATTLLSPDQRSRWVGVKEENSQVKDKVLVKGETFKGSLNLVNTPFLVVYHPLKNANNEVVGMIFTGNPQVSILNDAAASIEMIFFLTAILLVLSIIPAYLVSRYISYQLS